MEKLSIPNTTAETIMSTVEALSKKNGNTKYIADYVGVSEAYIKKAITLGFMLGLLTEIEENKFTITNQCKSISALYHENPKLIFKNALFQFEPFILLSSLLIKDNTISDSIRKIKAVYNITTDEVTIIKVFSNFCKYVEIESLSKNSLENLYKKNSLTEQFADRIVNRLNNEFEISTFLSEKLGNECYSTISTSSKILIIKSIINHKKEPGNSISDFAGAFETFLRDIGKSSGINLESCNGISQIGQVLASKDNKIILPEHRNLCDFFSTFRNPSSHKVQKNLIEHWNIGSDSSIEIILLGITSIRSIYEYINNETLLL